MDRAAERVTARRFQHSRCDEPPSFSGNQRAMVLKAPRPGDFQSPFLEDGRFGKRPSRLPSPWTAQIRFVGVGLYLRFPDGVTLPGAALPGFCVLRSASMKMK